jgi:hypothetical protein
MIVTQTLYPDTQNTTHNKKEKKKHLNNFQFLSIVPEVVQLSIY